MLQISQANDFWQSIDHLSNYQMNDSEQLLIISNFSWQCYEKILHDFGDKLSFKLTYCNGVLQVMSPSRRHEIDKKILGMLLETYFLEKKIDFYPLGSTTFRKENIAKGIEPDQSYSFDSEKDIPDLAIEIVVTSGGVNSLAIYKDLGVVEVWFWENKQFSIYSLQNNNYQKLDQSLLFPNLDFQLLSNCLLSSQKPIEKILAFKHKIN